jgi:hypothetical protein
VGDDGAAISERVSLLEPNLADEQLVKQIRFNVKNQRDCGAASAVGAGTVAISLLIGGGNVTLDAFYILLIAQSALLYAALFFNLRATRLMGQTTSNLMTVGGGIGSAVIGAAGSFLTSQLKQHGSNTGSSAWWWLLALAGGGALLGLMIRRSAESLLDELDDESWKQRLAPLVTDAERRSPRRSESRPQTSPLEKDWDDLMRQLDERKAERENDQSE